MEIPITLRQQIIKFLNDLPNINNNNSRQAFIYSAGLDSKLKGQIDFTGASEQFFQTLVETLLDHGTLRDGRHAVEAILEVAQQQVGVDKQALCDQLLQDFRTVLSLQKASDLLTEANLKELRDQYPKAWNPPRTPDPFIGREKDLNRIKAALGIPHKVSDVRSKIISIHGVPGVGKSTIAAWLANDPDILRAFPDAVLWSAFGQFSSSSDSDFEIRERLKSWGSLLGDEHLHTSMQINEMTDRLAIMLRNRQALLICDDVWYVDHMSAIRRLADRDVHLLITSRLPDVAEKVVSHRDGVMELKVFAESDAISLLKLLAPTVVEKYPDETRALVQDLEYLPLAINVVGHLLRREMDAGLDVVSLIEELRKEGEQLLKEALPVDMMELIREAKSPTIAVWLKRSTQMLDANTRRCFISLGYIAPKPATFGLRVLKRRWKDQNVNAVIRRLIDTGLIQATSDQRYQMHALLVTLARSLGKEIVDE